MEVSVVIATRNRTNDLKVALDSVLEQIHAPKEVIIVDDSDNDETENLIKQLGDGFKGRDIILRYIRNTKEKSLTIARNIGASYSKCDIILFLDDDVILDKNHIKEILRVYREKPAALGVQGYVENMKVPKPNLLYKFFFLWHFENDGMRVLQSMSPTYSYLPDNIISCQWLSGTNQSYRREVLRDFKFDENLKRYSYCEDVDFSYRVHKEFPNSLYMTPHAKLIHKAQMGELPEKKIIRMYQVYSTYLFLKNADITLKNKSILLWNRIGLLAESFAMLTLRPSKTKLLSLKYLCGAYILCLRHLSEIRKGDLEFFNTGVR